MITCMKMKSFILKYESKIMFYDVNIACYHLYIINVSYYNLQVEVALKKSKQSVNKFYLWHYKLRHVGDGRLHLRPMNLVLWVNY